MLILCMYVCNVCNVHLFGIRHQEFFLSLMTGTAISDTYCDCWCHEIVQYDCMHMLLYICKHAAAFQLLSFLLPPIRYRDLNGDLCAMLVADVVLQSSNDTKTHSQSHYWCHKRTHLSIVLRALGFQNPNEHGLKTLSERNIDRKLLKIFTQHQWNSDSELKLRY